MPRRNFTKPTKRAAMKRSGGLCEAVGEWYNLEPGQRCNADLAKGVEFDHIDLDANSKDNSLENCAAVCIRCHDFKTRNIDTPKAAKTLRQQDKARHIVKAPTMTGRPFPKTEQAAKRQSKAADKLPVPTRKHSLYARTDG